jgi:hypothetical protein
MWSHRKRPIIRAAAFLLGLGILVGGGWLSAGTRQEWLARRTELDRWLAEQTVEEATTVVRPWLIRRDPSRQYFYVPPEMFDVEREASAVEAPGSSNTSGNPAHKDYADRLFALAKEALVDGHATLAFCWLHEVLRFDPEHSDARRILASGSAQRPAVPRRGRKRHPRFDWLPGEYWQLDTLHFRIATNDSREAALQLARVLEELHAVWRQCFFSLWGNPVMLERAWSGRPLPQPARALHQVVLFRDREEYLRYLRRIEPRAPLTLGYYHAPSRSSYFFQDQVPAISTWRHEATHQLLHESLNAPPDLAADANVWIVEGIAVYMESLQTCRGYRTLGGLEAERLQYARYRALRGGFYMPLPQLTAMGREALQRDPQIRQLYSQAAGLTHFLMDASQGEFQPALFEYLRMVYAGRTNSNLLETVVQRPLEALDDEYRTFLQVDDQDLDQLDPDIHPTHLSLGQTAITDDGLRRLPDWRALVWLDLAGTRVSDDGLTRLDQAVHLRQLSLEATAIGDATVRRLQGTAELEELDLTHTRISDDALKTIADLPNLSRLWLTGTAVTDAGLRHLQDLRSLQTLEVSQTAITPAAWDEFCRQSPQVNRP